MKKGIIMKLWNKQQSDAPDPGSDTLKNLSHLANERVSAATRLDAALVEVEHSIDNLLKSDRDFFEFARSAGINDHGIGGHLRRVLRTLLVGQMQHAAPQFIKLLGIPFLPARVRGPIANAVARTANFDITNLVSEHQPKETVQ
jgi:hypothetical protein